MQREAFRAKRPVARLKPSRYGNMQRKAFRRASGYGNM